jgi:cell division protein FtsQ
MFKRKRRDSRRTSEKGTAPRRRMIRRVLGIAAVCALLFSALWGLNRPIRAVSVRGEFHHVTPLAIEQAVAGAADGSGILTVNLAAVRAAVDALPWVAHASVRRLWPHTLAVHVHEQRAFARWNGDGLVNRAGDLFLVHAATVPAGLPSLSGPHGTQAEVTRRYLRMSGELAPEGFAIASLGLSARGTWAFRLANGIAVRLGRSQFEARFEKFVNVALAIVKQRAGDISYIDMRYMNGFAIGWRANAPQDNASAPHAGGGRDA